MVAKGWGPTRMGLGRRSPVSQKSRVLGTKKRSYQNAHSQIANAIPTRALTWFQSCSLKWPITVKFER
jgi:hypothetical protein